MSADPPWFISGKYLRHRAVRSARRGGTFAVGIEWRPTHAPVPPGGKLDVRLTAHALEVATRGMQQGRGGSMVYPVYLLALHRAGRSAEADKGVPADVLPATGPAR